MLPFSIYVVQALFTAAVVVCSYVAHKYYSFRGGRHGDPMTSPSTIRLQCARTNRARRPKGTAVPLLTILTPCFNEEGNVREVYEQVKAVMATCRTLSTTTCSSTTPRLTERSPILREIAAADRRVKVIVNTRNFGQVRSPYHAFLEARGDASCARRGPPGSARDDPQFVAKWQPATRSSIGVKPGSNESWPMARIRRLYYWLVGALSSDVSWSPTSLASASMTARSWSSFEHGRAIPVLPRAGRRFGYERAEIPYFQPARRAGSPRTTSSRLYDLAMLGITSHSKVPLRLATMAGFALSILSLLVAVAYLILKLVWWDTFNLGLAPLVIGVYFFGAVQLFFIGMLGEYIGSIHTQVHTRPFVVERERINFEV